MTTNTTIQTDPRPYYRDALQWVAGLLDAIRAEQWELPTPCEEFDVRHLAGHLVATVRRAKVIGDGGDPLSIPHIVTDVTDDGYATAYRNGIDAVWTTWGPDESLQREVTAPWGTIPGSAAVWGYLNETLVHGWDLAVATGQPVEADDSVAQAALEMTQRVLPAEPRGGHVPFASPVEPAADAGPTERVANWSGRHR